MAGLEARYAAALLEAVREKDALEETAAAAETLACLLKAPGLRERLTWPGLSSAERLALLARRMGEPGREPSGLFGGLLGVVIRAGRQAALPGILEEFRKQHLKARGVLEGVAETARPLTPREVEGLSGLLAKRLGVREVALEVRVRPELLAGGRVHLAGRSFDATASGRLERLRMKLLTGREGVLPGPAHRAGTRPRAAADEILEGVVESARPLSREDSHRLAVALARRLGVREVLLEERLNPELLAGVRVHLAGRRFEASVSARLQELRGRLLKAPISGGA